MDLTQETLERNKTHYDELYRGVEVGRLVQKVQNVRDFLKEATQTDTSWRGLYQENFADRIRNKRVFEIGCGNGLNALVMAALGAGVLANDISTESQRIIEEAALRLALTNVRAIAGNFADLPLEPHSFDFVVGKDLLHHLTHELEAQYMQKISSILKPGGEARFFEPATNSKLLDRLRWIVPVFGRPSVLSRKRFADWKAADHHPARDNSSSHFQELGRRFFREVQTLPLGSIERLCRVLPETHFRRRFRRWAHRVDSKLPMAVRHVAARSQLIVYRQPTG